MSFKKKFGLTLGICLIFCTSNFADQSKIKDEKKFKNPLFTALENGLKNNKTILEALRELFATHENQVIAAAEFKPQISAEAGYKHSKNSYNRSNTAQSSHEQTPYCGIKAQQNLFHGFADHAKYQETKLLIQAKWNEYEAIKQKTLADIASVYFELCAKQKEIKQGIALLDARKESLKIAVEMRDTGSAKELDVSQAEASFAETEATLAGKKAEFEALKARFEELTGITAPQKLEIPSNIFEINITLNQGLEIAFQHNPSILASRMHLQAARKSIKTTNSKFAPSVNLGYSYDYSNNNSSENTQFNSNYKNNKTHSISLSASMPIYDAGIGRAEKRKFIEIAKKAEETQRKTESETKTNLISAFEGFNAAKQMLISTQKAVDARTMALHDTEEEYKAGLKIMNDVLSAQQEKFQAESANIAAEKEFYLKLFAIMSFIGRMNAKYLHIKDSNNDYEEHYRKTITRF